MSKEKIHEDALAMLRDGMPITVVAKILGVKVVDILHLDDRKDAEK
tara:strand:+ start:1203 stop:1340 length:138 start_codon:yes stop_codon:yes gene_type:complete